MHPTRKGVYLSIKSLFHQMTLLYGYMFLPLRVTLKKNVLNNHGVKVNRTDEENVQRTKCTFPLITVEVGLLCNNRTRVLLSLLPYALEFLLGSEWRIQFKPLVSNSHICLVLQTDQSTIFKSAAHPALVSPHSLGILYAFFSYPYGNL